MRKVTALLLVAAMVFALAACGGSAPAANNPPAAANPPAANNPPAGNEAAPGGSTSWNPDNIGNHTFILGHGQAETSQVGQQYHEFALTVEELSGGKMKVQERIAGSLVTDTETLDAIMNGTIDFAHSMGSYVSGTVTDVSPLTIAGYYGGDDWLGFAEDTHDLITDIYGDYGIKFVSALYQGNSVIVCIDKQIKQPEDVSGMTFRASGTWVAKTVEAWGGSPVTIGLADLADAFSKKTVQGTATGMNIIVPFKIYEVAEYLTLTSISEGFAALIMNGETWDSLNADEQALITEAGKIFRQKAYDIAIANTQIYEDTVTGEGRNQIYRLSESEQQEFISRAHGLYSGMESEVGDKGTQLINLLKQINGIS